MHAVAYHLPTIYGREFYSSKYDKSKTEVPKQ
jgi:hypothetical protein